MQAFIHDFGPEVFLAGPREDVVSSRSQLITARGSGGAPAANDFGAFKTKKEAFRAILFSISWHD